MTDIQPGLISRSELADLLDELSGNPPGAYVGPAQDWKGKTRVLWCFKCETYRKHQKTGDEYKCTECGEAQLRIAIFKWENDDEDRRGATEGSGRVEQLEAGIRQTIMESIRQANPTGPGHDEPADQGRADRHRAMDRGSK